MIIAIAALLSILDLVLAEDQAYLNESLPEVVHSVIYDDEIFKNIREELGFLKASQDATFKNIKEQIDLLKASNDYLRLKVEAQNIILDQQREETKKDFEKIKASLEIDKDLSREFHSNIIELQNEIKRGLTSLEPVKVPFYPANCAEALQENSENGIYRIKIADSIIEPFDVYCLKQERSYPWMIIQRRQDGSVDFNRNWNDYKNGFGNLDGEFFLGLDKLHALTQSTLHELWIRLEDFEGKTAWAKYSKFVIGGESENFALSQLGEYAGNAGDSFSTHVGTKWTTYDRDNDVDSGNCAQKFHGAWWYLNCYHCNLNGEYFHQPTGNGNKGIHWFKWTQYTYSLKYVHMAIRPIL